MTETVTVDADDLRAVLDDAVAGGLTDDDPVFDRLRAALPTRAESLANHLRRWEDPRALGFAGTAEMLHRAADELDRLAAENERLQDTITAMGEECSEVHGIVDDEAADALASAWTEYQGDRSDVRRWAEEALDWLSGHWRLVRHDVTTEQQDAAAETWPDDAAVRRAIYAGSDEVGMSYPSGADMSEAIRTMRIALLAAGPPPPDAGEPARLRGRIGTIANERDYWQAHTNKLHDAYVQASNPGIDMNEVRRIKSGGEDAGDAAVVQLVERDAALARMTDERNAWRSKCYVAKNEADDLRELVRLVGDDAILIPDANHNTDMVWLLDGDYHLAIVTSAQADLIHSIVGEGGESDG